MGCSPPRSRRVDSGSGCVVLNREVFYTETDTVGSETLVLRGDELKHVSRVLRKSPGDRILVTDGRGRMFDCLVTSVGRSEAVCRIEGVRENVGEPRVSVTLALSLLKNPARFDVAVEKVTELGVRTIVPIICERTVGRRPRMDRLAGIALAAMKQSGRCVLPEIAPSASFRELVTSAGTHGLRLLPHEKAGSEEFIDSVIARHQDAASVVVAIGPEGGFTEEEVSEATAAGFMVVSLGPRRLRAETAAIRAVSYIVGRE